MFCVGVIPKEGRAHMAAPGRGGSTGGGQGGHGPPGGREVPQLKEGSETYQPELREYNTSLPLFAPVQRVNVPQIWLAPPVQIFWIRLWRPPFFWYEADFLDFF